jgi:hypothetical protein
MAATLPRVKRWYQFVATTWLTSTLLFLLFTLACYVVYWILDPIRGTGQKGRRPYAEAFKPQALSTLSTEEALGLAADFDRLGDTETFVYQPWVGFSERPFFSSHLNVDDGVPLPHRRTHQHPASSHAQLRKEVWIFGGSTTFGWGVPDDQTIASHLAAILAERFPEARVTVSNHGHCYFYSSQEVLLFQLLLRAGRHCDLAIFLDGLNEFNPIRFNANVIEGKEAPAMTDRIAVALAHEQERSRLNSLKLIGSPRFPPVRLALALGKRQQVDQATQDRREEISPGQIESTARNYSFNLDLAGATARLKEIKTLFLWQPTPFDYFDPKFKDPKFVMLNELVRAQVKHADFHFLADFFEGASPQSTYVDAAHYGDLSSKALAQAIAEKVVTSHLLVAKR